MEVKCRFRHHVPELYECQVSWISWNQNIPRIKSFKGTHESGKNDSDVVSLLLQNDTVRFLPIRVYEQFPNLTHLYVVFCGLEKIWRQDISGLKHLEVAAFGNNRLTSVPDDLFVDMKKLRKVFFECNRITHLSSNLLRPIESTLEHASFSFNVKIDDYFLISEKGSLSLPDFMVMIDKCCEPPLKTEEFFDSWSSRKIWWHELLLKIILCALKKKLIF